MKIPILILALLGVTFLLTGCNKEKVCGELPTGHYSGKFTKSDGTLLSNPDVNISEINDTYIIINGSTVSREKCDVEGTIQYLPLIYQGGPVAINGSIKRRKGGYKITGTFYTTQSPWGTSISGEFVLDN